MSLIVDKTAAFFRIHEYTRNEFVAVGDHGNILRWKETHGDEQEWLFLPLGDRKYRIMTKMNGEYMAVGSNGNILRWAEADDGSQVFRLVNESADGRTMNFQTPNNEFVAVGDNGNVLRWRQTNGEEQRFTLEPVTPAIPPSLPQAETTPGEIGDIPRLKSMDEASLPWKSSRKIVGASLVPATLVADSSYSDKVTQMKKNPYYIAVRSQYWSREEPHGYTYHYKVGEERTVEKKIVYEVVNRSGRTSEDTWGWKFSINGQMAATGKAKNGDKVKASAGMAFEISHQLKTSIIDEQSIKKSDEETVKRTYSGDTEFIVTGWSLIDVYTLYKQDGTTIVSEVEAPMNGSLKKDSFPPNTPHPD